MMMMMMQWLDCLPCSVSARVKPSPDGPLTTSTVLRPCCLLVTAPSPGGLDAVYTGRRDGCGVDRSSISTPTSSSLHSYRSMLYSDPNYSYRSQLDISTVVSGAGYSASRWQASWHPLHRSWRQRTTIPAISYSPQLSSSASLKRHAVQRP